MEAYKNIYVVSDYHFSFKFMRNKRIEDNLLPKHITNDDVYCDYVVEKWNNKVSENDRTIFLGDLTFDTKYYSKPFDKKQESIRQTLKYYKKALETMKKCNGSKIWILGNHDRVLMKDLKIKAFDDMTIGIKNLAKEVQDLINEVFDNIEENPIQINNIIFTHEQFTNVNNDSINIHGHIHNGMTASLLSLSDRHINVNVEFTNFEPVNLYELLKERENV